MKNEVSVLQEKDGIASMVFFGQINSGDRIVQGKTIYDVTEVLEQRKEKGVYIDEKNRRNWFLCRVNVSAITNS